MIRSSKAMAAGALILSAGLHVGAPVFNSGRTEVDIEGGAPPAVARLGNSFADMVTGTATPVPAAEATPTPEVNTAPNSQRPDGAQQTAPFAKPHTSTQAKRTTSTEAASPARQPASKQTLSLAAAAPSPETTQPARAADQPQQPVETPKVTRSEPRAPTPPTDAVPADIVLAALPQNDTGVTVSRRPAARPNDLEVPARPTKPAAKPKDKPVRKAQPKAAPAGNSERTASRGSATGSEAAEAVRASKNPTTGSKRSGNAAVSNYPGQVMRRISRVKRPRVGTKGTALVAFSITASGGLGSARVARSSGSAQLDQAALQVVRRAAPFPRPPQGARRSFSVQIKGR